MQPWFDQITHKLSIDQSDIKAIGKTITRSVAQQQFIDQLTRKLKQDTHPCILFISVSDKKNSAQVYLGQGQSFCEALHTAIKLMINGHTTSKQLIYKVDIVQQVNSHTYENLQQNITIKRRQQGIAFAVETNIALLAEQVMARRLIDNKNRIRKSNLDNYLHELGSTPALPLNVTQKNTIYTFTTDSFVIQGKKYYPLASGNKILNQWLIQPDLLINSARQAGRYLQKALKKSGRFNYSYYPKIDQSSKQYNMLRHAGTIYAMLELYQYTSNEKTLQYAEHALQFLIQQIKPYRTDLTPKMCCVLEDGYIKLGGSALTILALSKYIEVTGKPQYLSTVEQLSAMMLHCLDEQGNFILQKQSYPDYVNTPFISEYYPGEAILAWVRAYQLLKKPQYLDAAEKAAQYLILERDKGLSTQQLIHDHWLLYGLNELYRLRKNILYLTQTERIAQAILFAQHFTSQEKDWYGGFYNPPRTTPTATRVEGLIAAYHLLKDFSKNTFLQQHIFAGIIRGTIFQLQNQFTSSSAMYLPNPKRALGGFRRSLFTYEIRIDYVQHSISSLLGLHRILTDQAQQKIATSPICLTAQAQKNMIDILLVGDTSYGENYQQQYANRGQKHLLKTHGYDYPLQKLQNILHSVDHVVANLETPFTEHHTSPFLQQKKWLHWSDPQQAPIHLCKHNITSVNLANNHILDFGQHGFEDTLSVLEQHQLHYFGAANNLSKNQQPLLFKLQFDKQTHHVAMIGCFLANKAYRKMFASITQQADVFINQLSIKAIREQIYWIKNYDPNAWVIVFPHWGANYQWKTRQQTRLAKQIIQAGANMIIGHGAHMLQEIQKLNGKWVVYSLGNFMFNSLGRYQKLQAPPYSLIARLRFSCFEQQLQVKLHIYPIVTDNRLTDYQTRMVTLDEFAEVTQLLSQQRTFETDQDQYGYFLKTDA
jgi:poly-gamma-glutamate capsule biosynthesis protein CapA/YwtB (metallophosphatase superfamily)